MECYAGLDVSMEETHICVLDREGVLIREGKIATSPKAISDFLAVGPECKGVVFETGRMAPMLYHGLVELGIPVQCIESRQAYQALKSLAGHKTDRNDARGLAHLARTGFYKPTHVKSLSANRHMSSRCLRMPSARSLRHAKSWLGSVSRSTIKSAGWLSYLGCAYHVPCRQHSKTQPWP